MSKLPIDVVEFIERMSVLQYKPGDIIVVQCEQALSDASMQRLTNSIAATFKAAGMEDVKVVILDEGMTIGVLRQAEEESEPKVKPNRVAFRCLKCGSIETFPIKTGDGRQCKACGGSLVPHAEVFVGVDWASGKDQTAMPTT